MGRGVTDALKLLVSSTHTFHHGFQRDWLRRVFKQAGFAAISFLEVMALRKPTAGGIEGVFPFFLMTWRKV